MALPFEKLTAMEQRCLSAALGRTTDQIADELGISPNTVKTHFQSVRRKLGPLPKGDLARAYAAWSTDHPFRTSSSGAMVDAVVTESAEPASETGAAELREERATFIPETEHLIAWPDKERRVALYATLRFQAVVATTLLIVVILLISPRLFAWFVWAASLIVPLFHR